MLFSEVGRDVPDNRFPKYSESCDLALVFSSRLVQKHLEAVAGRAPLQDHFLGWSERKLRSQSLIPPGPALAIQLSRPQ